MSNNNVILQQANRFVEQRNLLDSRQAFEDAVRNMTSGGLQFMVIGEPENDDGPWVIQKQQRTVQQGLEDEVEVLGTYWVVAEKIFMAPSVADILGSKIVRNVKVFSSFKYTIILSDSHKGADAGTSSLQRQPSPRSLE